MPLPIILRWFLVTDVVCALQNPFFLVVSVLPLQKLLLSHGDYFAIGFLPTCSFIGGESKLQTCNSLMCFAMNIKRIQTICFSPMFIHILGIASDPTMVRLLFCSTSPSQTIVYSAGGLSQRLQTRKVQVFTLSSCLMVHLEVAQLDHFQKWKTINYGSHGTHQVSFMVMAGLQKVHQDRDNVLFQVH